MYITAEGVVLANNVILGNKAELDGGGVFVGGAGVRLLHTTFARNNKGGGLFVTEDYHNTRSGRVTLTNTIFADHTIGISVTAGSEATLAGVLWYDNTTDISGMGVIRVTNTITGNPAFAADGYHLTAASAAVDGGNVTQLRWDIDSEPRPYHEPDLGADEYWPPGLLKHSYLPVARR